MNEEDKKQFLKDFKKVDVPKKLDMWCFALEQESFWDEILTELSAVPNKQNIGKKWGPGRRDGAINQYDIYVMDSKRENPDL